MRREHFWLLQSCCDLKHHNAKMDNLWWGRRNVDPLEQICEGLADTVAAPELWPVILERICSAVGGRGAAIVTLRSGFGPTTNSLAECFATYVAEGWYKGGRDLRKRAVPLFKRGFVATEHDIVAPGEAYQSDMHRDLLARFKVKYWIGVPIRSGDDYPCLSIQGPATGQAFGLAEKKRLAPLSTRLGEVAAAHNAFGAAVTKANISVLDEMGQAAIAIDGTGRALAVNTAAAILMGHAIRPVARRVAFADARTDQAFTLLLDRLRWNNPGNTLRDPYLFADEGGRRLAIRCLPLDAGYRACFGGAAALLLVRELAYPPQQPAAVLRAAFGLTAAEARVAARLTTGESLEAVADALSISKETARRHLRAFSKRLARTGRERSSPSSGNCKDWRRHDPFGSCCNLFKRLVSVLRI